MAKNLRDKRMNQILYISVGGAIAVIILFIILFNIFSGIKRRNTQDEGNTFTGNLVAEEANSSIGKNVDELEGEQNKEDWQAQQVVENTEEEDNTQVAGNLSDELSENVAEVTNASDEGNGADVTNIGNTSNEGNAGNATNVANVLNEESTADVANAANTSNEDDVENIANASNTSTEESTVNALVENGVADIVNNTSEIVSMNNANEANASENAQEAEGQSSTDENTENKQNKEDITNEGNQENMPANKASEDEKDPVFYMPVDGEIVKHYGKEKLIYSDTLKEWTTHLGIDIKADKTTIVKAASDGTVKSIKNDPRYGLTVVIEHKNGFSSVYSNLLTAEFVVVGETVKLGQTIGTVGNSATFEILDEPHLHFEIKKDGNAIDPEMYIK